MVYNYEDERFTFMKLESLRSKYGREWSQIGITLVRVVIRHTLPKAYQMR